MSNLAKEYEEIFGKLDIKKMLIDFALEKRDFYGQPLTMKSLVDMVKAFLYCEYSHVVHECAIDCKVLSTITCTLTIDESQYVAEALRGNRVDKKLGSLLCEMLPMAIVVQVVLQPSQPNKTYEPIKVFIAE